MVPSIPAIRLGFAFLYLPMCKIQGLPESLFYSLGVMMLQKPEPEPDPGTFWQYLVILEAILGPLQIGFLAWKLRRKFLR